MEIRFVAPADAPALLTIYAPYITDSILSFGYGVPAVADFANRIQAIKH